MGEHDILLEEQEWIADGAHPRDLSSYTSWRDDIDSEAMFALEFYTYYLDGQMAGMTDALSITAVHAAFEIDDIKHSERHILFERVRVVHAEFMKIRRRKRKGKGRHGN